MFPQLCAEGGRNGANWCSALYPRGDPYETSDPVLGVKWSLVVDLSTAEDEEMARKYGVEVGTKLPKHDFVLLTEQ